MNKLSAHEPQDYKINTEEKQPSFKSIYNSFVAELQTLYHYIYVNLENKFICKSWLFSKASIFFVKKKDDSLRLCVSTIKS